MTANLTIKRKTPFTSPALSFYQQESNCLGAKTIYDHLLSRLWVGCGALSLLEQELDFLAEYNIKIQA